MITKIKGLIESKDPGVVCVNVNGLCYEVNVSLQTFFELGDPGDHIQLYTHLVVREDAHILYGFKFPRERTVFLELLKTNGVGPKVALGILSGLELSELISAIQNQDIQTLCKIPGIGKKTGERLAMEMKDRIDKLGLTLEPQAAKPCDKAESWKKDAVDALVALGYKKNDADKAIKAVHVDGMSRDELIRSSLRHMV